MTESVRHQWFHSMHRCCSVHYVVTALTGLGSKSSEQHEEIGSSRCERDRDDMTKIIEWFTQHEPFDMNVSDPRSLSTGITETSDDGINFIHKELYDIIFTNAKIKRSIKINTLISLYNNVNVGKSKNLTVSPTIQFTRLVAVAQRDEKIFRNLLGELTAEQTSLFNEGVMRKPDKLQLRRAPISNDEPPEPDELLNFIRCK